MDFTDAELEIIEWALDDHIEVLTRWSPSNRPDLALLDTQALRAKVVAERERRAQPHPDHCLCDNHFRGLHGKAAADEMARRIRAAEEPT